MPLVTIEGRKQEWKIGTAGSATRVWRVFGTLDIEEVKTEIIAVAPDTWLTLGRDSDNITISEEGYLAWRCDVPYNRGSAISGGLPPAVFSFRVGGRMEKITQSSVVASYKPGGGSAPDLKGAINADAKGKADGVEFPGKGFSFEMEHWVHNDDLTNSYLGTLASLAGNYNTSTFRGFAAGEVMYLGCCGSQDSGGKYRLSHSFEASPNLSSVAICNGAITGVTKKGWQYLWVHYEGDEDSGNAIMKPTGAYVHELSGPKNFALIGLET